MHTVASHLRQPVSVVMATMSAQELMRWLAWMDAERVGPAWDRQRQAELLAAVYNGAAQRRGGGHWTPADFAGPDPWAEAVEPAPLTPEQHVEQIRREIAAMEAAFGG